MPLFAFYVLYSLNTIKLEKNVGKGKPPSSLGSRLASTSHGAPPPNHLETTYKGGCRPHKEIRTHGTNLCAYHSHITQTLPQPCSCEQVKGMQACARVHTHTHTHPSYMLVCFLPLGKFHGGFSRSVVSQR